ncbi:MAG: carbamoyltransferase HypF [Pirellulales bacterium]|nr:carbamoyltransferase HypF [Pirellulales bacterium]
MSLKVSKPTDRIGKRLILRGRVQGLGVRPTIVHVAQSLGLAGTVTNTNQGVQIEIEGETAAVAEFTEQLPARLPQGSTILELDSEVVPIRGQVDFKIIRQAPDEPPAARLPQDLGVCGDCLQDIANRRERRYRYPFTSCTACGPRYTMIRQMPYERSETTMGAFRLCEPCEREYTTPGDRRFHAQSTACPQCGPRIWISDHRGHPRFQSDWKSTTLNPAVLAYSAANGGKPHGSEEAMQSVIAALRRGQIVAVRGLGGYQLFVDATNPAAVDQLRHRKQRLAKPLAILVASINDAKQIAVIDSNEQAALADRCNPIVLVKARSAAEIRLASGIHPGLDTVGIMLPTTPLHVMIARDFGRPLVCTSANIEGEPLEYDVDAAQNRLAGICDLWLHHDRPIARPIDDSVVRVIAGRQVIIRLARGFAPYSLDLPSGRALLAIGGHLKGSIAWSNGVQAVLGPHIGDQEGLGNRQRLIDTIHDALQLYRFDPETIVHDAHPDYFTTTWAQNIMRDPARFPGAHPSKPAGQQSDAPGRRLLAVQHHHAHAVAGMLEHGWLHRKVLAVTWDGTGYGADGTIWGGEFLIATATAFERVASLWPFRLPGGEVAIREPWRIALGMLHEIGRTDLLGSLFETDIPEGTRESILAICKRPQFCPITTSAGRLFDAVAAVVLGKSHRAYDGQLAMELEAAADPDATGGYALPVRQGTILELDWRPLFEALVNDRLNGTPPGWMAMRFHRAMAAGIAKICQLWPELPVVLSGGVFQNRLLTELLLAHAPDDNRPWGPPGLIPPGDGGLAAGQLAIAAMHRQSP